MNAEQFTMWLHGFFEISGAEELSKTQVAVIKDHLDLLFCKVTPDRSKEIEEALREMRKSPMQVSPNYPGVFQNEPNVTPTWWTGTNPNLVLC